jgi:hypothetical protein
VSVRPDLASRPGALPSPQIDLSAEEYAALSGTCCYALNLPEEAHPGYERVLLHDVSAELLHIHDAQDAEEGVHEGEAGLLAAVAFRRR